MVTESYRNNKKVSSEGDEKPLTLPFKIQSGEKIAEGGESTVWQIKMDGLDEEHALKISRDETFATDEEMQKAEDF
jgi:hypothetical protein